MKNKSESVPHLIWLTLILACSCSQAPNPSEGVTGFEIEKRVLLGEGVSFGDAGSYETLIGTATYTLDPLDPLNSRVTDAASAVGPDGLVHYSADVVIVKPVDPARGNGVLLYHVVNRGRFDRRVLSSEGWSNVASSPSGSRERMGRLMKQGFTVVFSGWQADVTSEDDRLQLFVPQAGIPGEVLSEIKGTEGQKVAFLGASDHKPYLVDSDRADYAEMRVHSSYADPGTVIDPERWSFAKLNGEGVPKPDRTHLYYPEGFDPRQIYTVRYGTNDSPLMGLCFPAVRDLVTFLSSEDALNPLLDASGVSHIRHRLSYGSSQCGRYLRNFLYQGFNRSIVDTRVFDGVYSNVPGCRMGFFNYRHAQPSRAWGFYPNFDFPFTDLATTDPVTGETGGILESIEPRFLPKIFYVHHSGEYWSSGAALTHVNLEGLQDADLPDNVRIYAFTGTAHGFTELDQGKPAPKGDFLLPFNPNPTYLIEDPLVEALAKWVVFDEAPPPNSYPRMDRNELIWVGEYSFPELPDIKAPVVVEVHPRFDWGPHYREGVVDNPFPKIGELYPILVPTVGPDGNELGGIKTPHVAVPVASYTGWNYPASLFQGESKTCSASLAGAWLPFSKSAAERRRHGDTRKSLEERYASLDEYLEKLRKATEGLISRRLMFEEDLELVLGQGKAMYEYVAANGSWQAVENDN